MILSVEQEGIDVIQGADIVYSIMEGHIYGSPLTFEICTNDNTMAEDHLIQGGEYKLTSMFGNQIDVILGDIDPFRNMGENTTSFIFYEVETYKLLHNLFPPSAVVWGVSLARHIIGKLNQLDVVLMELRKMGLTIALTADLKIVQKHVYEYVEGEPQYISNIQTVKTQKTISLRSNYAMVAEGGTAMTITGSARPNFIPLLTEEQIMALDLKIEPIHIIISDDMNFDILLGSTVHFKSVPYSVMERQAYHSKDRIVSVITLGIVKEEVNT